MRVTSTLSIEGITSTLSTTWELHLHLSSWELHPQFPLWELHLHFHHGSYIHTFHFGSYIYTFHHGSDIHTFHCESYIYNFHARHVYFEHMIYFSNKLTFRTIISKWLLTQSCVYCGYVPLCDSSKGLCDSLPLEKESRHGNCCVTILHAWNMTFGLLWPFAYVNWQQSQFCLCVAVQAVCTGYANGFRNGRFRLERVS